ncbi:hypothetical protein Tco_1212049 [Tanacetum coccineum]
MYLLNGTNNWGAQFGEDSLRFLIKRRDPEYTRHKSAPIAKSSRVTQELKRYRYHFHGHTKIGASGKFLLNEIEKACNAFFRIDERKYLSRSRLIRAGAIFENLGMNRR